MAEIEIDGKSHEVKGGDNLLKTCLELGLDLPYFCWHPAMGSVGACRQCAVIQYQSAEDQQGRIVMACMTPVAEGMRISLQAPEATRFRGGIIELLMTNHPHDCPVCEEGGECHLQDMTEMSGATFRQYRGKKRTHRNQDLGPFINHEMNRCIACYRCVRYYQDYCGGDDLQVFASHHHVYFGRHQDGALENEFSGNLVEVCPTGVFTDKTFSSHYTRKWDLQSAPSICVHCALGCNTSPGERYGTLRRIVNRYHGEVNGYFLCDRGRFGYEFVNGPRRLRRAAVRSQPPLDGLGARNLFAKMLAKSRRTLGIGSPRASLEANFALREAVGPENFFAGVSAAEYGQIALMLDIVRNKPVRLASLKDAEEADAVFVLGGDPTQSAPRLALSLRQALRSRAHALADSLKIPRWQDAAVRNAAQLERSPLFIASGAPTRLDDVATGTHRDTPENLARLAFAIARQIDSDAPKVDGLSASLTAQAEQIGAALAAAQRPLLVCDPGGRGEAGIKAVAQVAQALANRRGKPADVHFVLPECNTLGLGLLGGNPLEQVFAAVAAGEADTVVVLENDLYRRASKESVDRFLADAPQVIVIDHLQHGTARGASLALPAASFAESEGTLVSSEGRAQRYFAAFQPAGDVRESWRWLEDAREKPRRHIDELTTACAEAVSELQGIMQTAPGAEFRLKGQKVPRQPHRYSGRTAMLANVRIHEPKQAVDTESALAFSMEGAQNGRPSALNPFVWAPGWNSNQAVGKFQEEIGGHLRGGDPGVRLLEPREPGSLEWLVPPPAVQAAPTGKHTLVPFHHIFGSEELSMLSGPLAQRAPAPYLALNPEDADSLGLAAGASVGVDLSGETRHLPVMLMPGLARGLAGIPVGLPDLPWVDTREVYWEYQGDKTDGG